MAVGLGARPEH